MLVEIGPSQIHGHGVLATDDILEGEWQVVYGQTVQEWNRFCFEGNPFFQPFSPFRFLNHADKPNCAIVDEKGMTYIVAERDIENGEELTIDYGVQDEAFETNHQIRESVGDLDH
jgi:hypothetical protein